MGQGAHQQPLPLNQQQEGHIPQAGKPGGSIGSALSPPTTVSTPGQLANGPLPGGLGESGGSGNSSVDLQRQQQYSKQQRWLLFLHHASKCTAAEGKCTVTPHCHMARQLWAHIASCRDRECTFARCNASKTLLRHHQTCRDARCPVCGPVRQQVMNQQRKEATSKADQQSTGMAANPVTPGMTTTSILSPEGLESSPTGDASVMEEADTEPPPAKRVKTEPDVVSSAPAPVPSSQQQWTATSSPGKMSAAATTQAPVRPQTVSLLKSEHQGTVKAEVVTNMVSTQVESTYTMQHTSTSVHKGLAVTKTEVADQVKAELRQQGPGVAVKAEPQSIASGTVPSVQVKAESVRTGSAVQTATAATAKAGKPKNLGTSLTELFTPEQIREHITGLRQWVGQVLPLDCLFIDLFIPLSIAVSFSVNS